MLLDPFSFGIMKTGKGNILMFEYDPTELNVSYRAFNNASRNASDAPPSKALNVITGGPFLGVIDFDTDPDTSEIIVLYNDQTKSIGN